MTHCSKAEYPFPITPSQANSSCKTLQMQAPVLLLRLPARQGLLLRRAAAGLQVGPSGCPCLPIQGDAAALMLPCLLPP